LRRDLSGIIENEKVLGLFLLLPAFAIICFVVLYPMIENFVVSFYNPRAYEPTFSNFVGLNNYAIIFSEEVFWSSLFRTVFYTVSSVALEFVVGLGLALALNTKFKGRSLIRGLTLLPWAVPWIATAFIFKWMYDQAFGVVNYFLTGLGLIRGPIAWLANSQTALGAVILTNVWRDIPFMFVILLAGLQQIPREVIDAAKVDGVTRLKEFRYITLPSLKAIIITTVLLRFIWNFNAFDLTWLLTQGGPGDSTRTLSLHAYIVAFEAFRIGEGAAIATVMFAILVVFSLLWLRVRGRTHAR